MVTYVGDNKVAATAAGNNASDDAAAVLPMSGGGSSSSPSADASGGEALPAAVASSSTTTVGGVGTASSISTEAVLPAAVRNEDEKSNDSNSNVCRFLITNLQGKRGYAKNDFRIDLLQSKHGLYDIAETVFDIMHKEKLTNDMIYSHLWDMSFNTKVYKNGWRRQKFPSSDEWDRPADKHDIDEGERRLFSDLEVPLQKGQKGKFGGESASFDFVLESITDMTAATKDKQEVTYPHVSKIPSQISTKVEDDWLTPSQKSQCNTLREKWTKFYKGNNSWKQVRDSEIRAYTRAKPSAPVWGSEELQIMGLLINADCKFKKCWTNIMQYAFVNRTESACSMRWYQLKKEDYRLKHIGKGLSSSGQVSLAKRLAKSMLKVQLERKPKKESHPYANAREQVLREFAERDLAYENGY